MDKEKLDRQLTDQTSAIPFVTVKDGKSYSVPRGPHNPYRHRQEMIS